MAELVIRELQPELDGYRDFCNYRENEATLRGQTKNDSRRLARRETPADLSAHQAAQQERRRHSSNESPTHPILRYR
jgi:hypothetical protein